jgi:hypothetical protein
MGQFGVKDDANVSDRFMKSHVVPNIYEYYREDPSNHIVVVLGPDILYACFTPGMKHRIAPSVYKRIREAYEMIRGDHPVEYNPVGKNPLRILNNVADKVEIHDDLVDVKTQVQQEPAGVAMVQVGANNQDIRTLIVAVRQNTQALHALKNEFDASLTQLRSYINNRFDQLDRNIARYIVAPVLPLNRQPQQESQVGQQEQHPTDNARLGKPKNLLMLWQEYIHGLPGNKPAKDFTSAERGAVKYAYSRKKSFGM